MTRAAIEEARRLPEVKALVDQAPPLTAEQLRRLARVLRPAKVVRAG